MTQQQRAFNRPVVLGRAQQELEAAGKADPLDDVNAVVAEILKRLRS